MLRDGVTHASILRWSSNTIETCLPLVSSTELEVHFPAEFHRARQLTSLTLSPPTPVPVQRVREPSASRQGKRFVMLSNFVSSLIVRDLRRSNASTFSTLWPRKHLRA